MNRKSKIVLLTLLIGQFMALMDTTIVNIAIPKMMEYFNCSLSQISWVATGYNLTFAVVLITASRLADQFGRKKIFMIGISLFVLTSIASALSPNIEFLIFFRLVQGLAAALIVPVTTPIALLVVEEKQKGLVLALWGAFSGLAATLGPVLGGVLTESLNWQSIFYINVPLGLLTLFLAARYIQESFDITATKKLDYLGIATISTSLFSLTFAFAQAGNKGWSSGYILFLFALFLVSAILFIWSQAKVAAPMVTLSLFRVRTFVFSSLTLFVLGFGLTSGTLLVTLLLTNLMGKSELHAGLIISTLALSSMLTSFFSGKISHKMGGKWLTSLGMLGLVLSTLGYSRISPTSSTLFVIFLLSCSGLALGLIMSPSMMSAIRQIPEEKVGIASGFVNMTRSLGQALGIALLTTVLTTNITHHISLAKDQAISLVDRNTVFDEPTKEQFKNSILKMNTSSFKNQKDYLVAVDKKEAELLSNTPEAQKDAVKQYFLKVKDELTIIQRQIAEIFKKEIGFGFKDSFLFAGLLIILGIIFALFSDVTPNSITKKVPIKKSA